jgi:hypothetical protein
VKPTLKFEISTPVIVKSGQPPSNTDSTASSVLTELGRSHFQNSGVPGVQNPPLRALWRPLRRSNIPDEHASHVCSLDCEQARSSAMTLIADAE